MDQFKKTPTETWEWLTASIHNSLTINISESTPSEVERALGRAEAFREVRKTLISYGGEVKTSQVSEFKQLIEDIKEGGF